MFCAAALMLKQANAAAATAVQIICFFMSGLRGFL
jgi:hypothetical protein